MRTILLPALLAILLSTSSVPALSQGMAAAPWPTQAQGRELPRPSWVLAIPARRAADGTLTIWDRTDEWAQAWRVPRTVDGIRVVTLMGDSEDSRSITPQAIDGMLVDEMEVVLRKYGAPALALVVTDGTSVAVAGYVPGWQASWNSISAGADVLEARENSVAAIGAMFTAPPQAAPAPAAVRGVAILAFRDNPSTGGVDYRVQISGPENEMSAHLEILSGIPGGQVTDISRDSETSLTAVVQRFPGTVPLEQDLAVYGLIP